MEKLEVTVNPTQEGEIIIREGAALPLHPPVAITITGNIQAVSSFLSVRRKDAAGHQIIDPAQAIVTVDREDKEIILKTHPNDAYGTVIKAKLMVSDELQPFFINTTKTFDKQELVKLLRFSRMYFDDPDKHLSLVAAYQSFTAQAQTDVKDESDRRGNKVANFNKNVKTNIPDDFILNIPIFKGMGKERFRVEICFDVTDGGTRFWFESVELNDLLITQRDAIIDTELRSCQGLVVIEA